MNTVMRTIGGAIGGEIAASLIAGHLLPDGLPAERGYTLTFALCAVVVGVGLVASLLVPRPARRPAVLAEAVPQPAAD